MIVKNKTILKTNYPSASEYGSTKGILSFYPHKINYSDMSEEQLTEAVLAIRKNAEIKLGEQRIKAEEERVATEKAKAAKFEADKLSEPYTPELNKYGNVGEKIPNEFYNLNEIVGESEASKIGPDLMSVKAAFKGPYSKYLVIHAGNIARIPELLQQAIDKKANRILETKALQLESLERMGYTDWAIFDGQVHEDDIEKHLPSGEDLFYRSYWWGKTHDRKLLNEYLASEDYQSDLQEHRKEAIIAATLEAAKKMHKEAQQIATPVQFCEGGKTYIYQLIIVR